MIVTTLGYLRSAPRKNDCLSDIQRQLGYEFTNVNYNDEFVAQSYRPPAIYDQLVSNIPYPSKEGLSGREAYYTTLFAWQAEQKKRFAGWVAARLQEYGYEAVKGVGEYAQFRLKVKMQNSQQVLLPNRNQEGTLLTFEPVKPLELYDMTRAGRKDGDLMEPDYHRVEMFRALAGKDYDGIKINDFAQADGHGNVRHTSIGIFPGSVSKVREISREMASHPEDLWEDIEKIG